MAKRIIVQAELDDSKLRKKLDDIGKRKEKITVDVDSGNIENTDQSMKHLNRTVSDSNSVFGRLKSTISNTFSSGKLAMTGYLLALNEINKAARNAKVTINDMDEAVTNLSIAMGKGRNEAYSYLGELNKQAKELGAKTKETADSADSWIRQGKNIAETEKLVRDSMVLSKLGKIESADASEYLTASLNGYKKSASEAIDIVDKLTAVDMESASDAGGLAVSLSKTASAANMAEVSFDRLVGMIATVKEVTQDSDESVGNMFKSTFSRMNQIKAGKFIDAETGESLNDVEKVLNKVGIAMRDANGEFISSEKIMDAVGSKWEEFDSTTQRAVATAMAGTYQYNKLIALFENYSKALQYTEVAADSAGTAMQKFNDSFLGSLEAKQNSLQASFESAIMNNDFSEVYGGILDATTVLVDFINQTNALKGALAGLTVAGGIKAFLTIKTGITEAYVALNKFQNALDITKKIGISTSEYERLLLLSNGLSASQMKLVLSTNSLTLAQKQELLMASGLSAEEAALQLETWGMTAANTGLTAATTTLGNAFKGLWATLVANPLIVVTAAVSAAVMAYQTYNQKLEETRRENIDNATAASEHANELRKQYDEYMRLASIQDKTTSQEEEFKTAVDNIIASLGSKADALKDLTVGTDEYASALARATKEELQSQAVNATVGRKSAEEEFQGSFWDDWKGSKVSVDSNDKGKSLSDEAQKAVNIVRDSLKEYETINRTWKNISWDISSDDPTEALEYYKSLVEAREKLVIASGDDEALLNTELYEDLNTAINTMSESLDTYIEKLYEEQKLNYMAQNGIPTTTEEYSAMEEAITGAAGSSETLQNKFQDLLMTDFAPLINEVEEVEKTVDSVASGMADPSLSISQTIDQLNTQLKPAFDSLKSAYQDIFTDDGFTLENVDLSMLDSIKSSIDDLNSLEGVDINVDYSSFENLAKVLTDSSSTAEDVKAAFNSLATEIVNSTSATAGMTDETRNMVVQLLESLGVTNAEEVAMYALSEAKAEAFLASYDLANATQDEITAMLAEAEAAGIATDMIFKLVAEEQVFNNQGLTTEGKVQELKKLAEAYGKTAVAAKIARMEDEYKKSHQPINYEEIAKAAQAEINNAVNSVHVDFSGIGKGAKSAGSKAGKDYKDGLKEQLSDLDSVISGITSRIDDNIESVRTQKEEAVAAIDAQIDALNEQKSALEDQKKALEEERDARIEVIEQQKKQLELAIKAIDKQIKQKEKVIKGIQDEINSLKNANEQRKLQLNLQREQYELERLQQQRTILQYSAEKGMHYVQDTKSIRDQKEKVDDAKLEIEIAKKQQQIDLIEKEIDLLNEKKEAINEQIEILDEQKDQINEFYDKQIKAIDKQIEAIDKQIEELQKQKEETEKYYESLIENMEKSKSKYEELTELVGKAELSAKLKQLGIDEEALVNGSEEEFQKLKNAYLDVVFQLNSGNKDVLVALQELSGYNGTAPAMLDDSNTKLGTMNDELGNANKEVGNVNTSLGNTASTTGKVSDNIGDLSDKTTGLGDSLQEVNSALKNIPDSSSKIGDIAKSYGELATSLQSKEGSELDTQIGNINDSLSKIPEANSKIDPIVTSYKDLKDSLTGEDGASTNDKLEDINDVLDEIPNVSQSVTDIAEAYEKLSGSLTSEENVGLGKELSEINKELDVVPEPTNVTETALAYEKLDKAVVGNSDVKISGEIGNINTALGETPEPTNINNVTTAINELSVSIDKSKQSMDALSEAELNVNNNANDIAISIQSIVDNIQSAYENVETLRDGLSETNTFVVEEQIAFDILRQKIDEVVEVITEKISATYDSKSATETSISTELEYYILLKEKLLEVKESLDSINEAISLIDAMPINNLTSAFQLLYDKLLLVSNLLGVGMEGAEEGAVSGIAGAIQALNEISLEEGIIAQFTMLKEAIDSVTAAISGGGGESSEGEGSGGGSGSKGGQSGGKGGKGSQGKGESGGGNSLTGAIKEMGETAKEVIGEPDAEGDGTVIGEFGSMETAVNDVRDAIGTEGSEGGEGGSGGKGETDDTLVGSIEYLGDKTEEEMGELDGEGILGKFNEFKCVIEEAANQVKSISEGLDEIDGKEVECTITINVKMNGSIPHFAPGTVLGNMQIESATYNARYGKAFASGTIGLRHDEKNALRSEYGQPELTVYPNGMTELTTSPVMSDLPKGTVIYNEEETKKIMDNKSNSVGNAHANGTDDGIWTTLADGTRVRELQPGDRMYDMMQKFDAYFNSMDGNIEKLVPNSVYEHQRQMEDMAKQINYVSSVVNNNRNVQQPVHNEIHITCPGVTSEEVAQQVGVKLNNMFSGLHLEAMQQSMKR